MAFKKFIDFQSEFTQQIFNAAFGALWSINGRLNGFVPVAVGGGSTPGIVSTTNGGNVTRVITVNLTTPATPDDYRGATQTTSFAIANGVILKSDADYLVNTTLVEPVANTLQDVDPLVIYVTYDDVSLAPVFGVKRESVIDAGPTLMAKLCDYSPVSQTWVPRDAVSMAGVFTAVESFLLKHGGFVVAEETESTISVSPGTIVGSYGRIINGSIQLASIPALPSAGMLRKDLVVVTDPVDEASTTPLITIIPGIEDAAVTAATSPPKPTSPSQIPIAELWVGAAGIGIKEIIDSRPIQSWQTDAMMQMLPQAFSQLKVTCVQPGVTMTDTTSGSSTSWSVSIFRALLAGGGAGVSKLVFGIVSNTITKAFVQLGAPATFTPTSTQFSPAPYTVQSTFKVLSASVDVTNVPAYAIKYDFLNGVFQTVTSQNANEIFEVHYQTVNALFAVDDDGTVHLPALDLFYNHIDPANSAAHTSFNITHNNTTSPVPGTSGNTISVAAAINALAGLLTSASASPLKLRTSLSFGRNNFAETVGTVDHGLAIGHAGADLEEIISTKAAPYYLIVRDCKLNSMSFSMGSGSGSLFSHLPQFAQLSLWVNGNFLAQTDLASVSGSAPFSASGFTVLSGTLPSLSAGDHLAATITFSAFPAPWTVTALTGNFGIVAHVELEDA